MDILLNLFLGRCHNMHYITFFTFLDRTVHILWYYCFMESEIIYCFVKMPQKNNYVLIPTFYCYREFYYIQMEKYARQAISEGLKTAEDLHVAGDSELYRVLNLHYNRNNHIEVNIILLLNFKKL